MQETSLSKRCGQPVVIGGVGGSGTRLISRSLVELGYLMGDNLNRAYDNLWFTLLFKRLEVLKCSNEEFDELLDLFVTATTCPGWLARTLMKALQDLRLVDRPNILRNLLRKSARFLLPKKQLVRIAPWGWKEPNAHVFLSQLSNRLPAMKYIHVTRNGLDMAHSGNQQQLKLWGPFFIGEPYTVSPYYSLKFWCAVHRKVLRSGAAMSDRFLLLNYDEFCLDPASGISRLCEFLKLEPSRTQRDSITSLVRPPASIGRFQNYGTDVFDVDDVAYVRELGFDVGERESRLAPAQRNAIGDTCKS